MRWYLNQMKLKKLKNLKLSKNNYSILTEAS